MKKREFKTPKLSNLEAATPHFEVDMLRAIMGMGDNYGYDCEYAYDMGYLDEVVVTGYYAPPPPPPFGGFPPNTGGNPPDDTSPSPPPSSSCHICGGAGCPFCRGTAPGQGGEIGGGGSTGAHPPQPQPPSTPQAVVVILDKPSIVTHINYLRNLIQNANEHGLAVQLINGTFFVLSQGGRHIVPGTPEQVEIAPTPNTIFIVHTHPPGRNPAPAPGDAMALVRAFLEGSLSIAANVVLAHDGSEYMVFVSDRVAFRRFANEHGNAFANLNNGAMFPQNSTWLQRYNDEYERLSGLSATRRPSPSDRQLYALIHVLQHSGYNTGLSVYRKRNGGFQRVVPSR